MTHLIIGNGNMGRRHGMILEAFGDCVIWIDQNAINNGYLDHLDHLDSVLICTPPETHIAILATVMTRWPHMSVFVEKPLYLNHSGPIAIPKISHVANNWFFCPHLPVADYHLQISYPANAWWQYDILHFIDNIESDKILANKFPQKSIRLIKSRKRVIDLFNSPHRYTLLDGQDIHNVVNSINVIDCPMFIHQMRYWRRLLKNRAKSINPIPTAIKLTACFINQLNLS